MNINKLSWAPLPSRALSHGTLPSRSLKRPKSALLKSRVVSLLCALLAALRILELYHFWVTAAKAALELHIPHQPLLVGENKVQHRTSRRGLLYHLEEEVVLNAFQEPPGLPVCYCVVPSTGVGVVEVPHEDQGF